jgi:RNA polymerase sigma-70 factor, ECF subfamily
MADGARQREFEALLAPVIGGAYGLALHMARNRDDADDLVQEAALQAFRAFHTFTPGTNFRAWFYRIVTNAFRYRYRKKRREPEVTAWEDAPDLYLYSKAHENQLFERCDDPASAVLGKLSEAQVAAAIEGLPEEFRVVCSLNLLEDFAYQEIADILECPVGTVRSRLHRGRKILQKALWEMAEQHGIVAGLKGSDQS